MQPQLRAIIENADTEEVAELLDAVFTDLGRLLGYLSQARPFIRPGDSPEAALFLLDVVRSEALAAASSLDLHCENPELPRELREELERASFAIGHELKAVFGQKLAGLGLLEDREEVRSRLEDAHDLLRNCFQQSTISVARVFRPGLSGADIFEELRAKRDNSVRLYEDLSALLRSARFAEWRDDAAALSLFTERLEHFRNGSMQFLMQKDCETCLHFMDDFALAHDRKSVRLFMHRFACYLEILLKHVGMRSVLAEASVSVAA